MKFLFMTSLVFTLSCTSKNHSNPWTNEFVQMNEIWKLKPRQQEVTRSFGPRFENVPEGISYRYGKTAFTKMAFFFDKEKKLIDQFAIVDEAILNDFKNGITCEWIVKKTELKAPHVTRTVESGECPQQKVKYFFRKDLSSYEIRWF